MATETNQNPILSCPACGYSLQALTHASCPECGQVFAIISQKELERQRRWLAPYVIGLSTIPILYLLLYLSLRVTGVYASTYNLGNWEVKVDSNSEVVDTLYLPLSYLESEMQFHFSWFHDDPLSC
jgi:predicted RNA-binding Zn-ribbon protein involved in translation (DUF1610 family)